MTAGGGGEATPPSNDGEAHSQWFLFRFLRLAAPFFASEERWTAWPITGGLIALTLLQIGIAVRLGIWNQDFFNSLDKERWDKVLSGGEQQRLAFGRLLLHKPDWVFMDEATSALDEEIQQSMMALFDKELAGATVVSIAHRPGMEAFHSRTLKLVMSVKGARLVTKRSRPPARRTRAQRQRKRKRALTTMGWRRFRPAR